MFPYRCSNCNRISYSGRVGELPSECCSGASFCQLVSICLVIPCMEDQALFQSKKGEVVDHETYWKLACGKTSLPPYYTAEPDACTCQICRKYADELMAEVGWDDQSEPEDLQLHPAELEYEDTPPNPFAKTH